MTFLMPRSPISFHHTGNRLSRNDDDRQINRRRNILNSFVDILAMQLSAYRIDKIEAVSPTVFLQKQGNAIAEAEGPSRSYDDHTRGSKKL